jgi:NADH-quinone oxidoreductase subunit G
VVRLEARYSEAVNGYFICDRGRYGFSYASHPERPRRALADGDEISYDWAVKEAAGTLDKIAGKVGPQAIGCIGSARNTVETQAMLARVCRLKKWSGPVYFADKATAAKIETAASRLETRLAVSLRELERSDCIIALGVDPINEAPMLALAMRQAQRRGAEVLVLDPRPIFLPLKFQHLPVGLDDLNVVFTRLIKGAVDRGRVTQLGQQAVQFFDELPRPEQSDTLFPEKVAAAVEQLRRSEKPVIVCGTEVVRETTPALAADAVLLLQAMEKQAGLFYVLAGPNAFGATLLKDGDGSLAQIIERIEKGDIKALLVVDSDPFTFFPDRQRLNRALEQLEFLVVLDYVVSASSKRANIFLPTQSLYEAGGTFINQEGRLQAVSRAYGGGAPISQVSGGWHPPRLYGIGLPDGEAKAAWQTLGELAKTGVSETENCTRVNLWKWLAELNPAFGGMAPLDQLPEDGIRLRSGDEAVSRFSLDWQSRQEEDEGPREALELILVEWTFGTEELSVHSPHLRKVERNPCLYMEDGDARKMGLNDGDKVLMKLDTGTVQVDLRVEANMASGVVVLPRHHLIEWQKLKAVPALVRPEQIEKARKESV